MSSDSDSFDSVEIVAWCVGSNDLPAWVSSPCCEYHRDTVICKESNVWSGVVVVSLEC